MSYVEGYRIQVLALADAIALGEDLDYDKDRHVRRQWEHVCELANPLKEVTPTTAIVNRKARAGSVPGDLYYSPGAIVAMLRHEARLLEAHGRRYCAHCGGRHDGPVFARHDPLGGDGVELDPKQHPPPLVTKWAGFWHPTAELLGRYGLEPVLEGEPTPHRDRACYLFATKAHAERWSRWHAQPLPVGIDEDARCNRLDVYEGQPLAPCDGVIILDPPENCSCHLNAPCGACLEPRHNCPECGWHEADD